MVLISEGGSSYKKYEIDIKYTPHFTYLRLKKNLGIAIIISNRIKAHSMKVSWSPKLLVKVTKKNKFTVFLMDILVAYKSL